MSQSNAFVNGLNWRKPFYPNSRRPDGSLKLDLYVEGLDFLDNLDFAPTVEELNTYGNETYAGIHEYDFETYHRSFLDLIYQKNSYVNLKKFHALSKGLPNANFFSSWTDTSFVDTIFGIQVPEYLDMPLTSDIFPNDRSIFYKTPSRTLSFLASADYETIFRSIGESYLNYSQSIVEENVVKSWNTPEVKAINLDSPVYDSYIGADGSRIVVGQGPLVIKYNANGTKPYQFNKNISKWLSADSGEIRRILPVDGGNKFLLFGKMDLADGNGGYLAHYAISINSDGTLDTTVEPITYNSLVAMGYDIDNMYNTYIGGDGLKIIDVIEQGGEFVVAFNYSLR